MAASRSSLLTGSPKSNDPLARTGEVEFFADRPLDREPVVTELRDLGCKSSYLCLTRGDSRTSRQRLIAQVHIRPNTGIGVERRDPSRRDEHGEH